MPPWLLMAAVAGAPCTDTALVTTGDTVMCDGVVGPVDDVRWLLHADADARACGVERDGCKLQLLLQRSAHDEEVATYEEMLAVRADRPFSWATLAIGLAVGLVAGAAVAYVVTKD